MLNLDGEDTPGQCQSVFEKSDDLVVPLVIARQRTMTRHMPGDRCVKCLKDRGDVAISEVVVPLTDDGSVGRDHGLFLYLCSLVRSGICVFLPVIRDCPFKSFTRFANFWE